MRKLIIILLFTPLLVAGQIKVYEASDLVSVQGEIFVLQNDIVTTNAISLSWTNCTLDGQGHTISGNVDARMLYVKGQGNVVKNITAINKSLNDNSSCVEMQVAGGIGRMENVTCTGGFRPLKAGSYNNILGAEMTMINCVSHNAQEDGIYIQALEKLTMINCWSYDVNRKILTDPTNFGGDAIQIQEVWFPYLENVTSDHRGTAGKFGLIINNYKHAIVKKSNIYGHQKVAGSGGVAFFVGGPDFYPDRMIIEIDSCYIDARRFGIEANASELHITNSVFVNSTEHVHADNHSDKYFSNNYFSGNTSIRSYGKQPQQSENNIFNNTIPYVMSADIPVNINNTYYPTAPQRAGVDYVIKQVSEPDFDVGYKSTSVIDEPETEIKYIIPNIVQERIHVYLNNEVNGSYHLNESNAIEHALLLRSENNESEIYYLKKVRIE